MTVEEIWQRKSDEEVMAAATCLGDYTEVGQRIILLEMRRRGLAIAPLRPEPDVVSAKRHGGAPTALAPQTRTRWYIALAICVAVWLSGAYYLYDSYKTGDVEVRDGVRIVTRELDVDRNTGKVLGEKSFIESRQGTVLFLLTFGCGFVSVIFIALALSQKIRGLVLPPSAPPETQTTKKAKRPTSITVICVIGFLGALITVPLVF